MTGETTFDVITQREAQPTTGPVRTDPDPEAEFSIRVRDESKTRSDTWRDQLVEDWDFFLGAQIAKSKKKGQDKKRQKTYGIDVIFQAVEQAIALLTSNRPRFSATGTEDSDVRIAHVYSTIMQFLWYTNGATQKLKQVIRDYYVGSVGWFLVYWNPFAANGKGDIAIDTIDPKRVYVDEAKDFFWDDACHMVIETFLTQEALQRTYGFPQWYIDSLETTELDLKTTTRESEMASGSAQLAQSSGQKKHFLRLDRFSKVLETVWVLEKEDERTRELENALAVLLECSRKYLTSKEPAPRPDHDFLNKVYFVAKEVLKRSGYEM